MPAITSPKNQVIKLAALLVSSSRERRESGLFVAEGARLTAEALNSSRVRIKYLLASEKGRALLLEQCKIMGLAEPQGIIEIDEALSKKISDTKTPQGVFAVCEGSLTADEPSPDILWGCLILCSLADPGNVGTILRSADAFGLSQVVLTPDCPQPSSPKVLRASMGAAFRVEMAVSTAEEAVGFYKSRGRGVYAASLSKRAHSLKDVKLEGAAVLIGNEGAGLGAHLIDMCDGEVFIPISKESESLNAAMAATIFCYEMGRLAKGGAT